MASECLRGLYRLAHLPRHITFCAPRSVSFRSPPKKPYFSKAIPVLDLNCCHIKNIFRHNLQRHSAYATCNSHLPQCHNSHLPQCYESNSYGTDKLLSSYISHRQGTKPNQLYSRFSQSHSKINALSPLWVRSYATAAAPEPVKQSLHGIQKDVSSLTTKRVVRRKKSNDTVVREQEYFDVVAFATAEEFNLEAVRDEIAKQGLYDIVKLPEDAFDSLHVEARYKVNNEPREVFFFREGSVVFWNMQQEEQQTLLNYVRPYQSGTYDSLLTKEELEKFEFTYAGNKTVFAGGEIHLRPLSTPDDRVAQQLEMFAFSNALSLSVKLAIWEASLEKYVDSIEWVLQDLKNGKKIRMSEAAVLKKAGELFTLSHLINLSSDLLDTPDFYWDRDTLEKIYIKTCNHLNISRRTRVMNEKLSQCRELTELLRDHLKDKHHTRLELMIIFLILIEVVFQVFHLIEKYYWGITDEEIEKTAVETS